MKTLLTFTGFHDPYHIGLLGEEEQAGPIISLFTAMGFDRVVLFSTPNTARNTEATRNALISLGQDVNVVVIDLPLEDPTDYLTILKLLRSQIAPLRNHSSDAEFFISVASGTPQMHACWVLLAASGELPARILHVRPPRFVTAERPLVSEIDLTSPEFPTVRKNIGFSVQPETPVPQNAEAIVQQLKIVGDHAAMKRALEIVATLASSDAPILILGESGTGKELVAKFVHLLSGRPTEKFVPLNCAAIPKDLVESILFGHRKGAFTGAINDQTGKFDLADGGTLFLDELAELPLETQAKLLRVIQDGQVESLGDKKTHGVDVRIIAATNANLARAIKQGKFRADLYYRLNVGEVRLPPLRERRSDIPILALHLLDHVNTSLKRPKRFTPAALTRLQSHDWPGNIRDLANVIERSARLARTDVLDADDLLLTEPVGHADPLSALPEPREGFSLDEYLTSARKQLVLRALEIGNGNQSEAARLLGVTPQAVHKFLQKTRSS